MLSKLKKNKLKVQFHAEALSTSRLPRFVTVSFFCFSSSISSINVFPGFVLLRALLLDAHENLTLIWAVFFFGNASAFVFFFTMGAGGDLNDDDDDTMDPVCVTLFLLGFACTCVEARVEVTFERY